MPTVIKRAPADQGLQLVQIQGQVSWSTRDQWTTRLRSSAICIQGAMFTS